MNIQLINGFTNQGINHSISILNFPNDYNHITVMNAVKYQYMYGNRNRCCKSKMELELFCVKLFNDNKNIKSRRYICLDIIDILFEFNQSVVNRLVEELRNIERNEINNIVVPVMFKNKIKTVYNDSQNVHTSEINNSVKNSVIKLLSWYKNFRNNGFKEFDEIKNYFIENYDNINIRNVLKRIENDISSFNIEITLKDVFVALYNWILLNDNKNELEKILLDEMYEMDGYCATGHLSRMINVTQGFSEDFCVNISIKEQCNAVVSNYLNKKLQESGDNEILDGIMYKSEKYLNFIEKCIVEKIDEWKIEYGDEFINNISIVVSKFVN
jgi:uncharacterized protein with HEPN domain